MLDHCIDARDRPLRKFDCLRPWVVRQPELPRDRASDAEHAFGCQVILRAAPNRRHAAQRRVVDDSLAGYLANYEAA